MSKSQTKVWTPVFFLVPNAQVTTLSAPKPNPAGLQNLPGFLCLIEKRQRIKYLTKTSKTISPYKSYG
jgi:hypothetical protein